MTKEMTSVPFRVIRNARFTSNSHKKPICKASRKKSGSIVTAEDVVQLLAKDLASDSKETQLHEIGDSQDWQLWPSTWEPCDFLLPEVGLELEVLSKVVPDESFLAIGLEENDELARSWDSEFMPAQVDAGCDDHNHERAENLISYL